ncbi:hypothetical protein HWV62_43826 [Athelia sp. TMB]|nr:hypothetical protein HWV62_43826 [Athelia sp. TMB]
MANVSCTFTSINDVLAQAEAGQLNITAAVSTCQGLCTLAWGVGNPDLSGIGLNISYILQAVLTVLFGPLFCLLYWYRQRPSKDDKGINDTTENIETLHDSKSTKDAVEPPEILPDNKSIKDATADTPVDGKCTNCIKDTNKNLEDLHDAFLDVSAQFSIPVAVATVTRFLQNPPFYEITFMHSLTTMQFLSLLSTAVTAGIFKTRKEPMRITVICLYGLLEFGFYMGLVGGLRTSGARWDAIDELGEACKAYGTLLPGFEDIPKLRTIVPHFSAHQVLLEWGHYALWKASFIVIGLILAGFVALAVVVCVIWGLGALLISQEIWVLGSMSLAFTIATIVELVRMERTRSIMQAITGAEFGDNAWGFGQVVSLFLWVPISIQAAYTLIEIYFPSSRSKAVDKAGKAA